MIKDLSSAALAIVGGAFTLAIISVLVSRQSATSEVVQATGSAVGNIIGQAVSPVTGVGAGTGGIGSKLGNGVSVLHSISSGLDALQQGFGSGTISL